MVKELYIKPEVKKETLEAQVLTPTYGSPGNNGGVIVQGGFGRLKCGKKWH
jgi:hypothetical protein